VRRRFRRGGVPWRLAVFFNGIVMFVVGLSQDPLLFLIADGVP